MPRDPTLGASITTNTRDIWPYHAPAVSNSSPELVPFTLSARRTPKRSTAATGNAAQVMRGGRDAIARSAKVKAEKAFITAGGMRAGFQRFWAHQFAAMSAAERQTPSEPR